MSKLQNLKKRLGVEGAIAGVAIAVIGGITYFANSYSTNVTTEQQQLQQSAQSLQAEYTSLIEQQQKAKSSLELYQKLTSGKNGGNFELDRRVVSQVMNKLVAQYLISDLKVSISPVETFEDPVFTKKTGKIISSTVTLTFGAASDELVFAFVQRMSRELTGYMNIKELSLKRLAPIDNKSLYQISQGQRPVLVEAQVVFDWLGLQQNEPAAAPDPAAQGVVQ